MPADLPLRDGRDPAEDEVEADGEDADDPEGLGVVGAGVHEAEDDGEEDAAEVAAGARGARDDAVGVRVHVRDEREVGAVAGLEEDGHERHEPDHRRQVVRVRAPDHDEQGPRHAPADDDPRLLGPDAAPRRPVQRVGRHAAERARDDVEEPEHGGPVGRVGLAERREVLGVVRAEDGVDGELAAERAHVCRDVEQRLRRHENVRNHAPRRLLHHLALGRLHHVLLRDGGFVVPVRVPVLVLRERRLLLLDLLDAVSADGTRLVRDPPRDVDDAARVDAVGLEVLLGVEVSLGPLAGRRVGAEEEHGRAGSDRDDEGNDEREAPRDSVRVAASHEGVEDSGHNEIGNATTRVTPSSREGIGRAYDVLIEETGRPHLARHKGPAQDTDEEATDIETLRVVNQGGETERDRSEKHDTGKHITRSESITSRTGDKSY